MLHKIRAWVATSAALLPGALFAQPSGCYPSISDQPALLLRAYSRYVAAATDSISYLSRADLGIALLDSTKVVMTVDSRTCANVVSAINAYDGTPGLIRHVQVAQLVKSGFMAYDGSTPISASSYVRRVYVITTKFVVKQVLLGL